MNDKRIIACLDVSNGRVVKGKKFKNIKDVAEPIKLAKQYDTDGADELVFYDITATVENRHVFLNIIKEIATNISIPFMVGGGIRTINDIENTFDSGADKISINSAAINNPELLEEAVKQFGSEAITLGIDAKEVSENKWHVFINGGRKDTEIDVIEWAKRGEQMGIGEIIVNSMDTDGVKKGYNIKLNQVIAKAINIPIIASGGAGSMEHFYTALTEGMANGALAASVFHYGHIHIPELKKYLLSKNIS